MQSEQNQLIIQFLERVVDENIKTAEKMSSVKFLQEEQRREVGEVLRVLRNGLRDDIKKHISNESETTRNRFEALVVKYEKLVEQHAELYAEIKEHRERNAELDEVLKDIRKKGMWFRGAIALIVALATIAGAFVTLSRISGWSNTSQPAPIVQPQNQPTTSAPSSNP
jgi:hypothetical protein